MHEGFADVCSPVTWLPPGSPQGDVLLRTRVSEGSVKGGFVSATTALPCHPGCNRYHSINFVQKSMEMRAKRKLNTN